ncbi:Stk1 family PASTA domain-containing Ser/Thr kinase [Isachenkonia alkalipeptolytica]|uniref:non-specific serine/threonine protein kinase n=1 Tax=Isachenkonia alkalipeptolytica TaxID=2565777 RepID=A0AA44BG58_9CLOT|nr:Stk1 family PASTA domain-containing Ser/Thr kinase [Isachenkonia alkalipeptolytica]NBG89126.1 Stk1 family PASTA domain-containing Ser/Thr kinase [Isachenkonia alkalipeptolytica]
MIGNILGNRYEVLEKIGDGGMALVYKGKCQLLNRYVGIKVLRPEFIQDKDVVNKFKRESQAAASLSHPNIVNVYDVGQYEDTYYIVMELVEGITLKKYIQEKGKLSEKEALQVGKQVAKALKHAHSNSIIHRDIKPHNILIQRDEDGRILAKVTDFGIALATTSSTLTNTGSIVGSVHYFSPEQGRGGYVDEKSDLYSLGITLYEMVTGRVPFNAKTPIAIALKHSQQKPEKPSTYNPEISSGFEALILKLLEKEQSMRYQNAELLIQDFNNLQGEGKAPNPLLASMNAQDATTQVLGKNGEKNYSNKVKRSSRSAVKEEEEEKKSKKPMIAIGIIAALIAILGITLGALYVQGLFGENDDIQMPEVVGLEREEAVEILEEHNLEYESEEVHDAEVPENFVISQNPSAGISVKEGSTVDLRISLGPDMALVPNLIHEREVDAELILDEAGLIPGEVTYEESDFPEGVIIEQDPGFRSEVSAGSEVNFTVSEGRPESMPDLSGLTRIEAERIIRQTGLIPGEISEDFSEEVPQGRVISQSIESGETVEPDETVDLVLSLGEEPEEEEEEPDPEIITKELEIDIEDLEGTVDIEVREINENRRYYRDRHNADEESLVVIPIEGEEGSGQKVFDIFINGEFQREVRMNF